MVDGVFNWLGVDNFGFDGVDCCYLIFIVENYVGGFVGVEIILVVFSESCDVIEEVIEFFFL